MYMCGISVWVSCVESFVNVNVNFIRDVGFDRGNGI